MSDRDDLRFDFGRVERIGLPEAVFSEGKDTDQLVAIVSDADARDVPLLLTRLGIEAHARLPDSLRNRLDYDPASATAFTRARQPPAGAKVAVVTAGTVDVAPAREAIRTLQFHGVGAQLFADLGVAGLWRLLERRDEIAEFPVVIAVAGMEGALFSVLAGLVPGLMIAVPTSNGYGVAEHGRLALHAALSSCSPGVVVCNIDNGYGAACAALRVLRISGQEAAEQSSRRLPP